MTTPLIASVRLLPSRVNVTRAGGIIEASPLSGEHQCIELCGITLSDAAGRTTASDSAAIYLHIVPMVVGDQPYVALQLQGDDRRGHVLVTPQAFEQIGALLDTTRKIMALESPPSPPPPGGAGGGDVDAS